MVRPEIADDLHHDFTVDLVIACELMHKGNVGWRHLEPLGLLGTPSPSTPRASLWRWRGPTSWGRAIRIICWPTAATGRSRKRKSRDIANNTEIDVIWETFQETLEHLRQQLSTSLG